MMCQGQALNILATLSSVCVNIPALCTWGEKKLFQMTTRLYNLIRWPGYPKIATWVFQLAWISALWWWNRQIWILADDLCTGLKKQREWYTLIHINFIHIMYICNVTLHWIWYSLTARATVRFYIYIYSWMWSIFSANNFRLTFIDGLIWCLYATHILCVRGVCGVSICQQHTILYVIRI